MERLEIDEDGPAPGRRNRRIAVSATPVGKEDLKNRKKAEVVPKSPMDQANITKLLMENFLFSHLDEDSVKSIVDVVFPKSFSEGEVIIQQGDSGEFYYILEEGECDCFVGEANVKTCVPGDGFGELALMYNAPRAATVKATTEVKVWALDRDTFKMTLMEHTQKKRDMYEAFLEDIPILSSLQKYERLTIADALRPRTVPNGEAIITQGDAGEDFFIVERGVCNIVINGEQVGTIDCGGYFGELALLNDKPRAASIVAGTDDVKVLAIDRQTFTGVMGPLQAILQRNGELYEKYKTDME